MGYSIFLSYRRDDAPGYVARLSDDLTEHFGDVVFRDVDAMQGGDAWRAVLEKQVSQAKIVLAVIGARWEEELLKRKDAVDYVRQELNTARRVKTQVIPICLNGTQLPDAEALGDLAWLHDIHVYELSDSQQRWGHDLKILTKRVAKIAHLPIVKIETERQGVGQFLPASRPIVWSIGGGVVTVALLMLLTMRMDISLNVFDWFASSTPEAECLREGDDNVDGRDILARCEIEPTRIQRLVDLVRANEFVPAGELDFFVSRLGITAKAIEKILAGVVAELEHADDDQSFEIFARFLGRQLEVAKDTVSVDTDHEQVKSLVASVNGCLRDGDYNCADRHLMEAAAIEGADVSADSLPLAQITFARGKLHLAKYAYGQAAQFFALASEKLPTHEVDLLFEYRSAEASAYRTQAEEQADSAARRSAVSLYQTIVESLDKGTSFEKWVIAKNDLGVALRINKQHEKARDEFIEALAELDSVNHSSLRALTENNLGKTLRLIGSRASGTNILKDSVLAFDNALALTEAEGLTLRRAEIENNRGVSLRLLGVTSCISTDLEKSLDAFGRALAIRTKDRTPFLWAKTKRNIGASLRILGYRTLDTERLSESIEVFEQAAKVMTLKRSPVDWASTRVNLGASRRLLGRQKIDDALLEEALGDFRVVSNLMGDRLKENNKKLWLGIQRNIAATLFDTTRRYRDPDKLGEALAAAQSIETQIDRDTFERQWATSQSQIGSIHLAIAERSHDAAQFQNAIARFEAAAAVWEPQRRRAPLDWAAVRNQIGKARLHLGRKTDDAELLNLALTDFNEAMREREERCVPSQWADTQHNIGIVHRALYDHNSDIDHLTKSALALEAALRIRGKDTLPFEWASSTIELAATRKVIGERNSDRAALIEARDAWDLVRAFCDERRIDRFDDSLSTLGDSIDVSLASVSP